MMKKMAFLPLLLLIAIPTVTADCFSYDQETLIRDLALNSNISESDLMDIFDILCNISYTRIESDMIMEDKLELFEALSDVEDINRMVDERMTNYTSWYEEEIDINRMLLAIYDKSNRSEEDVDMSIFVTKEYLGEELKGESSQYRELDDKVEELEKSLNNTLTLTAMTTSSAAPQYDWTVYAFGIAIFALFIQASGLYDWYGKIREHSERSKRMSYAATGTYPQTAPAASPQPAAPVDYAAIRDKAASYEGQPSQSELEDVELQRERALKDIVANKEAQLKAKEIAGTKNQEELTAVLAKHNKEKAPASSIPTLKKILEEHEQKSDAGTASKR